jgi:hypothetical protein
VPGPCRSRAPHDQHQNGRLNHRGRAEHRDLRRQIRRRRQAGRLLASEDDALADQLSNRQGGPHEDRTGVQQDHDLLRLVRRGAVQCRLAESRVAGHSERQQADDEWQQDKEPEVSAVGADQSNLAVGHC